MKIIITRPEPQASALKALLEREGHEVLISSSIEYIAPEAPLNTTQFSSEDRLIFVSRQAVTSLINALGDIPESKQIFAVGKGTAHALKQAGINNPIYPEQAKSEGLLALPDLQNVVGESIKIINGGEGRQLLCQVLTERGANVETLASYARRSLPGNPQLGSDAWKNDVDCVVLTSLEIAQNFVKQLEDPSRLQNTTVTIMSQRMHEWADELNIEQRIELNGGHNETIVADIRGHFNHGKTNH